MYSKIEQININDMFDRAMSIKKNTVITYTDLKTDKEMKEKEMPDIKKRNTN